MLKEFKAFAVKGNAIDLATGVIIGAAFGKVVSSLVSDIIMPPIGLVLGHVDFSNLFINLSPMVYGSVEEAKKAGAPTINYGIFLNNVIDFLIVGFCVFLLVRQIMKFQRPEIVPPPPPSKDCPYCAMAIRKEAIRCPYCTSPLENLKSV